MDCDRTILVPDATAIVKDQDGNELARENIASGATGIIEVTQPFETFDYEASHDGSVVSYADYDAKWVYDNIIVPELNSFPDAPKVLPEINALDPRLLVYGVGGNGLNHFENLQRFTDENGLQDYSNGVFIDHLTGFMHAVDTPLAEIWENQLADVYSNFNALGLDNWYVSTMRNYQLLVAPYNSALIPVNTRPWTWLPILSSGNSVLMCSTTKYDDPSLSFRILSIYQYNMDVRAKDNSLLQIDKIVTRKAFKYDPITNKMILDL